MIERLILFHMPQSTFSEDAVPGQVGNQLDQFLSTTNRQKRTLNHKSEKKMAGARHMQFGNEEALVDLIVTKVAIVKKPGSTCCVLH